ncbi:MAG: transporter substrate-binding domain-containing protein, partial [Deltaproteobacteria bacterium]|nr:transporter substrate-binding domain-containing protein [Deltaproteobacteria bacterium]
MKQRWINTLLIIIVCLSVLGTVAWVVGGFDKRGEVLDRIKEKGKITVITSNNSNCYYIYRDRPMGFEYELAKAFADYLDVKLEVITPDWDEMLNALDKDKGDLVAASMTSTPDREEIVDFSDEYLSVQQDIIVHKGNHKIKGIEDLSGKKVHVREGTSYHERLLELKKDGLNVEIILHENVPTEELIRQVAEKEIEITVADSNIALLNRRYYPAIRIAFPIEEQQSLGWAVRKGNSKLLAKINKFFDAIEEDGTFG